MTKYQNRLLKSFALFMFLLMMSVLCLIFGFILIDQAETTTINQMTITDIAKALSGSVFVFSTFVWISCMRLVGKVK